MGRISTLANPAYIVIDPTPTDGTYKGLAGVTIEMRDADTGEALPPATSLPFGFVEYQTPGGVDRVEASVDGWVTILGPWLTIESQIAATLAGAAALAAQGKADQATRDVADLSQRLSTIAAPTWDTISGVKPYAPKDHTHPASAITVTPTGALTATDVQSALQQLLSIGGSGGGGSSAVRHYYYKDGAWVDAAGTSIPAARPAGVSLRWMTGPTQPVSAPDWGADVTTLYVQTI